MRFFHPGSEPSRVRHDPVIVLIVVLGAASLLVSPLMAELKLGHRQ